jgi:DNA-binding transcriptional regulator YiaG
MATKVKTSPGRNVAIPKGLGQPTTVKSPQGVRAVSKLAAAQKPAAASKATPPKAATLLPKTKPSSKPTPAPNSKRLNVPKPADSNLSEAATRESFRKAKAHQVAKARSTKAKVLEVAKQVAKARSELGVTQEIFARMIGVSARSIAGWEKGSPINEGSYRRVLEMERLASSLKKVMKADYIPRWLVTPNEGMGGISPVQALESGANDRFWRSVFLLGSGLPL